MIIGANEALAPRFAAIAVVGILLVGLGAYEYLQATSFHPRANTTSATSSSGTGMSSSVSSSSAPSFSTVASESSSTISPAPCALPYLFRANATFAYGTQMTDNEDPVLVVSPGSTVELCVEFADPAYTNQSVSTSTSVSAFSWPESPVLGLQPANNVSTTATPENISLSAGQSTVIEYKISTGENSTGFDGLLVAPLGELDCQTIPVAVGYQPSQVNSSDFSSYYHGITECPVGNLAAAIVGYTGARIAYLRNWNTVNPTESIDTSVSSFPTSGGGENITFRSEIETFFYSVTIGGPAGDASVVSVFTGNPELVPGSASNGLVENFSSDECSWSPGNQTAVTDAKVTAFNELPVGYLKVDAPTLQIGPDTLTNYTFSILISGPIARYTAIDVTGPQASDSYFPVSVAGQMQTISGTCELVFA